jgi:iron(III) transport system substrate-binding protein
MAKALKDKKTADAAELAAALGEGVSAAYKAVMKPSEGTILTVSRLAAAAAAEAAATEEPAVETVDPASIKGEVSVYVAHNGDQYNRAIELFNETYPNIEVLVVSAGTGDCLQRIAAEAENPQCDVMWGGTTESLEAYKQYFQPYVCSEDSHIAEKFKDPDDKWIGESQQPSVIIVQQEPRSRERSPNRLGRTFWMRNGRERSLPPIRLPPARPTRCFAT